MTDDERRVRSKSRLRAVLRVVGLVVGVGLAIATLLRAGPEGLRAMLSLGPLTLASGLAILLVGALLGTTAWWLLLGAFGGSIPFTTGVAMAHLSQLGKYVPGMVVVPIAQAELGRSHGLRAHEVVGAFSLSLVLGLASSLIVGFGALGVSSPGIAGDYTWGLLVLIPLPLLLSGRLLSRGVTRLLRLVGRPVTVTVQGRAVRRSLAVHLVASAVGGLHVAVLAIGLGADPVAVLLPSIGAFSLAWAVGFLVAFVPAGLGVREGVLTLALTPLVGATSSAAIAITSRVLFTIADLVLAGAALYLWRRSRTGDVPAGPASAETSQRSPDQMADDDIG
jgi:hypothetical protein